MFLRKLINEKLKRYRVSPTCGYMDLLLQERDREITKLVVRNRDVERHIETK
jgi:hypothetical protein